MSQPIPPTPGSGLSPSLLEFAVVAIVSLAVAWALFLYFGPLAAAHPLPIGRPITLLQP
jgi:hypothetical protein